MCIGRIFLIKIWKKFSGIFKKEKEGMEVSAMGVRITSGLMGLFLLVGVLKAGKAYLLVAVFIIAVLALKELYDAFSIKGFKPLYLMGYLWVFLLFLFIRLEGSLTFIGYSHMRYILSLSLYATFFGLMLLLLFEKARYQIQDLALSILGVIYVGFLFTFIPETRFLPGGEYLVWIIFVGAWVTDTFAYFVGVRFGKRKIIPSISPNKTLEGFVGGTLGCMLVMVLYGWYLKSIQILDASIVHFVAIGILCGIVAQIGDWFASAVKRFAGVKDFGKIMPGHGGVLDRFDSILVIAPFVYHYLAWMMGKI
jgi:phosphatidate cytidylyltransferase